MNVRESRFTRASTRLALQAGALLLGGSGVALLAHFLFREVAPALERLEAPERWWSGIVAFALIAGAMVMSAVALTSSVLARLARMSRERSREESRS